MKRRVKISRASYHPKQKASKAPLALIVSAACVALTAFIVFGAVVTTAGVVAYKYYNSVVPDGIQAVQAYEQSPYAVSTISWRDGTTMQQLVNPKYGTRVQVPLKQIPANMKWATVDIENRTFYSDIGVDPIRLLSATKTDLSGGTNLQGASTLTEQLVKLALYGPNAVVPRKLDQSNIQIKMREIMVSIGLTRDIQHCNLKCRKDAILEMYLNTVTYGVYGGDIHGVEAAAEYFFGIHASQLDLAQSALLAGLPQAPSQYDPVEYKDRAKKRQLQVLSWMLKDDHITQAQYDAAKVEPLHYVFKPIVAQKADNANETYFVQWLLKEYLSKPANLRQFGISDLQNPDDIYRGFVFKTTLDSTWQQTAQDIINNQVAQNINTFNMKDGALVAIDPRSNEIKAYVGGTGWNSGANGSQYDMAWQLRQAGSSFKPFMYVTAFENGHFPGQTINDAYVSYPCTGSTTDCPYVPHNYDLTYHGLVTIRQALANSYNVPAVKTLVSLGTDGVKKVIATTNVMGYHLETQDPKNLGPAMTLGTDRGRLLEEVNAYSVFANNGVYRPYMPILAIYRVQPDGSRKLVWQYKTPKGQQVIAPQFAYEITDILKDTAAKQPAFGSYAFSYLGLSDRPVASKTGTTSDFKDNLTLGYTPDLVAGVWVGNPDNTPMPGSTGITGAAPAWHAFMTAALQNSPPQQFVMPTGIITATVARYAPVGGLPGLAASGVTDIFAAGTVPTTWDNPALDDYSGRTQTGTATPGATTTATASGTPNSSTTAPNGTKCAGGYSYTTEVKNGQTIYHVVCR